MERTERIATEIIAVAKQLYPHYTQEQHLAWAVGFLATIVMEKNNMDNKVFANLKERLSILKSR